MAPTVSDWGGISFVRLDTEQRRMAIRDEWSEYALARPACECHLPFWKPASLDAYSTRYCFVRDIPISWGKACAARVWSVGHVEQTFLFFSFFFFLFYLLFRTLLSFASFSGASDIIMILFFFFSLSNIYSVVVVDRPKADSPQQSRIFSPMAAT